VVTALVGLVCKAVEGRSKDGGVGRASPLSLRYRVFWLRMRVLLTR